jgi:hypothetical protein
VKTDANQPTYTRTAIIKVRQSPRDFKIERAPALLETLDEVTLVDIR